MRQKTICKFHILIAVQMAIVIATDGSSAAIGDESDRSRRPNFVLILCDNLGWGDVGCYGSTKHRTPHIDRLASEGMRLTSFYVTSGVCTPSRASIMTGCYPRRVNMHMSDTGGSVLRPVSTKGLHPDEVTIAEVLKSRGYATTCIGKWHLGDQPEFLPTRQGFDEYFGIPYSDDMTPRVGQIWPPLPLMHNEKVAEAPVDRHLLTKRYTAEAIDFMKRHQDEPFFVYLPHAMPGSTRAPFASEAFRGKSANGPFGDSVEELDWSTGELMAAIKNLGIDDRTLVIWTSDNGAPRRTPPQGSNRPLGGWGYTTREGGMRMPCIVRWPSRIKPGTECDELLTSMDFLPTFARLAGAQLPPDRVVDGKDAWPVLAGESGATSPHAAFYYYHVDRLQAVRAGKWKLFLPIAEGEPNRTRDLDRSTPLLFDVATDVAESKNLAKENSDVVQRLMVYARQAIADLGDGTESGQNQRPAGFVQNPQPQIYNP